MVEANK